jgi:hypothetical protein
MKLKVYNEYNNFYPLPTIRVYWDEYYEGEFCSLNIELVWLKWTLALALIDK